MARDRRHRPLLPILFILQFLFLAVLIGLEAAYDKIFYVFQDGYFGTIDPLVFVVVGFGNWVDNETLVIYRGGRKADNGR